MNDKKSGKQHSSSMNHPKQSRITNFFGAQNVKDHHSSQESDSENIVKEAEISVKRQKFDEASCEISKSLQPSELPKISVQFEPITQSLYENWLKLVPDKNLNPVSPDNYVLNTDSYHPITSACWRRGERIPFRALCKVMSVVDSVSMRLKMLSFMERFFISVILLTPSDLLPCISLLTNQIFPSYEGKETGIGDTLLIKAVAAATGRDVDKIKSMLASSGDLGIVTKNLKVNQSTIKKPKPLLVDTVYKTLRSFPDLSGPSSQKSKFDKISGLIISAEQEEAIYLPGILKGKLRIGLAEKSLIAALASAHQSSLLPYAPGKISVLTDGNRFKEVTEIVKTAIYQMPNYEFLIENLLLHGSKNLSKHCTISPGYPVKPMLANPSKDIQTILSKHKIDDLVCEYKYDGERAQIHRTSDGQVMIFSRNQENNTGKYPDIVQFFTEMGMDEQHKRSSFILDCEVVAWDKEKGEILPFQVLSNRKRKSVELYSIKVSICMFAFDLLYYNGESLLSKPLAERRKVLHECFLESPGKLQFAVSCLPSNTMEISKFVESAVSNKCEGIMIKTLTVDATYEIAKRSHSWYKFKKDYVDTIGDTVDLVVMGAYHGKGKRTGSYGAYLLGCYDPINEEYQSICKIGTGFTDEDLSVLSETLNEFVTPKPHSLYRFSNSLACSKWFSPSCVWEVKAADLTISPIHFAALDLVKQGKGISLRFPRFIRVRNDKSAEDATTSEQIAALYTNQLLTSKKDEDMMDEEIIEDEEVHESE